MGKKRLKTNRLSIKDFDMAHYRTTDSYTKAVDKLFVIATNEITNAASKADFDPDKPSEGEGTDAEDRCKPYKQGAIGY